MKTKHLVQIAAVLALSAFNLRPSTTLAQTNRVGVITATYIMSASGSGQFNYSGTWIDGDYSGQNLWAGNDQLSLSISGQVKYEVLQTDTNLIIGSPLSSSASETASGNEHTHYMGEQLNGYESPPTEEDYTTNLTFVADPGTGGRYSYPTNVCVMLTSSPDGSGQFLGTCGKAVYGSTLPDGSFDPWNNPWTDDGPSSDFTGNVAFYDQEGQACTLYAQDEVRHFQFAMTNCALHWSLTVATNTTVNNAYNASDGSGSESGSASGSLTITLEYVPYQLTVPFTAAPTNGPVPLAVQFSCTNMDSGGNVLTNWNWNFGDGTTGTNQAPSHTYTNTNTFLVTLAAINVNGTAVLGLGATNIVVALPTVQFTAWPTNGYMPLLVEFSCTNVDSGTNSIVSWLWYFGDGSTSTNQNPSDIYLSSKPKTFSPKLYATNVNGTAVVATGPKISAAYPPIGFTASPTNGLVPLPVQFHAPAVDTLGVTITNWTWSFGDGATSVLQNPFHTYTNTGIFSPTLLATNQNHVAIEGFGPNISAGCREVYIFGASGSGFDPASGNTTNRDGIHPQAALTVSGNRLYGVMSGGGNGGSGTIFAVNTDGSGFTNLYSFSAPPMMYYTNGDGESPRARLVLSSNTLYGAASSGGTGGGTSFMGQGTLFKINTDGSGFATLFDFPDGSDGGTTPNGLVLSSNTLYGTTAEGGSGGDGTVFKIATDGSGFTRIHDFSAGAYDSSGTVITNGDGAYPQAPLLLAGNSLYGTTTHGGASGGGTLFRLNTDGSGFTVLHTFTNSDGLQPCGELLLAGSTLYGTAAAGGSGNDGVVFKLDADGSGFTTIYTFAGDDGAQPQGGVILSGAMLYGTTEWGGSGGSGTIFEVNTNGTDFATLYSFSALDPNAGTNFDGANPCAGLVLSDGNLYATTFNGGSAGDGALFTLSLVNGTLTVGQAAPQISIQPTNQSVALGGSASFSVSAAGSAPLVYQWQFDGANLTAATNATLVLNPVAAANAGSYDVVVTNAYGSVTSSTPTLSVLGVPVSFVTSSGSIQYSNGQFHLTLSGLTGQGSVLIEASTDLTQWTPVFTNPPGFGTIQFVDPATANFRSRYYRATTPGP